MVVARQLARDRHTIYPERLIQILEERSELTTGA